MYGSPFNCESIPPWDSYIPQQYHDIVFKMPPNINKYQQSINIDICRYPVWGQDLFNFSREKTCTTYGKGTFIIIQYLTIKSEMLRNEVSTIATWLKGKFIISVFFHTKKLCIIFVIYYHLF